MDVAVRSLSPTLGVEITGLDLSRDPGSDTAATLRTLFDRHHLLLLRQPGLTPEQQTAVVTALGPVSEPHGHISNVEADGYQPEWPLLWHSDFAFTPTPLLGISLYALDIGPGGAPTRFTSTVAAASELPPALRRRLEGLEVVHMADVTHAGREDTRQREAAVGGSDAPRDLYPRTARPALWRHPRTGQELLFVCEQQASHFLGMTYEDADALLDEVFAHLYDARRVYEHDWQVGDLMIWDNLAVQHSRPAAPVTTRRSLRRVTMTDLTLAEIMGGVMFHERPDVNRKAPT